MGARGSVFPLMSAQLLTRAYAVVGVLVQGPEPRKRPGRPVAVTAPLCRCGDTVPRVSPQKKGLVRPADADRIRRAVELKKLAELELSEAIVEAMRHGGSIREVALVSGLSDSTVLRWRAGRGLPTHDDLIVAPARERREMLYAAYPGLRQAFAELLGLDPDKQ